jgi:hypothetical protein
MSNKGRFLKLKNSSVDYNTPPEIAALIQKFFNNALGLDPCSNKDSYINALKKIMPPIDGLNIEWNTTVFCNPPYGRGIGKWLKKCSENNYETLALIPVATNTSHWRKYIFEIKANVCFLYEPRVKFWLYGNKIEKGAPMACCIVYWGQNLEKFIKHFSEIGAILKA